MAREGVFHEQAREGLHVFLRAFALAAVVHALLEIIQIDVGEGHAVEGLEVAPGGAVAVHRFFNGKLDDDAVRRL